MSVLFFYDRKGRGPILLSKEDEQLLEDFVWHTKLHKPTSAWYATSSSIRGVTTRLHRLVIGAKSGQLVDHINGDGLDNRRENLRIATRSQNKQNARGHINSSSRYKGVHVVRGTYHAYIQHEGKLQRLGKYPTELDAAKAYNEAATRYFGQFAKLNEVTE